MWSFAKGHGTQNDFILLKDRHAMLCPTDNDVRYLCDRRSGIGADGILRVVKAGSIADWDGDPNLWFMDYRNADGSIAEMCGNGLRVFVRYLAEENLISGSSTVVATRAGLREAQLLPDGRVQVAMGSVTIGQPTTAVVNDRSVSGVSANVGNPHLVVTLDSEDEVRQADLSTVPRFDSDVFPSGANLELAAVVENKYVMRVHERGVGETRSCGTGAVAVAAVLSDRQPGRYKVKLPGGCVEVIIDEAGQAQLVGPAVIVARGEVAVPE